MICPELLSQIELALLKRASDDATKLIKN